MATVEILVHDGGKRTEIRIDRLHEIDAIAEAVGLLLASRGSEMRAALSRLGDVVRVLDEFMPGIEVEP